MYVYILALLTLQQTSKMLAITDLRVFLDKL